MSNKINIEEESNFCYSAIEMENFGNSINMIKLYSCKECNFLKNHLLICGSCNRIYCKTCFENNNKFCNVCIETNGNLNSVKPLDQFTLKTFKSFKLKCPRNNCNKMTHIDGLEVHIKNDCKGNQFIKVEIDGYHKYDLDKEYTGVLNGFCIEYFNNGQIKKKGIFVNGYQEGEGSEYWINGNIVYKGNYKNGLYDGKGSIFYENELFYEGTFENGLIKKVNQMCLLSKENMIDGKNLNILNKNFNGYIKVLNDKIKITVNN